MQINSKYHWKSYDLIPLEIPLDIEQQIFFSKCFIGWNTETGNNLFLVLSNNSISETVVSNIFKTCYKISLRADSFFPFFPRFIFPSPQKNEPARRLYKIWQVHSSLSKVG